jgi:hypothetical protein
LLVWGAFTGLLVLLVNARFKLEAMRADLEELQREVEIR